MPARPFPTLRALIGHDAAGGVLLIAAAAGALIVANGPLAPAYAAALLAPLGPLDLAHWIDDGLMALFFLYAGLEIKRELVAGELASAAQRRLPIATALAGMIVPALVYLAVVREHPGLARGWAVPAATDIAFAVGILALAGARVPASLRIFLTSVAIVDDIGAIAIIALVYTRGLDPRALGCAGALFGAMIVLNRLGVRRLAVYVPLAVALWAAVLMSGVHATVAGVLAAFAIPASPGEDAISPLDRLEHRLATPVALVVVPLFGFANAGVSLAGVGPARLLAPLPLAIMLALFLGKQAGVFAAIRLAAASRFAEPPTGASWAQVYGVALLCGIGFTMSLFIGALAFPDAAMLDEVKIGVLAGSGISAIAGFAVLRLAARASPSAPGRA